MTRSAVVLLYLLALGFAGCADEAPAPRPLPVTAKPVVTVIVPEQMVTVVPAPAPRGSLSESPIRAPDQIPELPAQTDAQIAPPLVISPEPLVLPTNGSERRYQIAAERFAKLEMCNPSPQATLQMRAPGVEVYAVACLNGDALIIRCEFGNCRDMQ